MTIFAPSSAESPEFYLGGPSDRGRCRLFVCSLGWGCRAGAMMLRSLTLPTGGAIRLFRPTGQSGLGAALLWIHGGGYVVGRACQDDMLCRRFGLALGITVASVEYRLAPEHPYPAGLEDCYRALARLASLPDVDPARIAVGGASAGSGLAAALNQLARDRGEINPLSSC